MLRLGLFGGTFDPVHLGHLLVAQAAREELALDRIHFIPAAQSPFKPEQRPAPGPERVRLLRLALAGQTACEVDPQELNRAGISFTIDTVRDYMARFPGAELSYLIGADHVAQLPQWREAATLAQLVEFVVIPRPVGVLTGTAEKLIPLGTGTKSDLVAPGEAGPRFRIRTLRGFPVALSSSQIRQRIREGLSIETLVPPGVAEAIRNNRLYLSSERGQC